MSYKCSLCKRDCHSRIGLNSHSKLCINITLQAQIHDLMRPKDGDEVNYRQGESGLGDCVHHNMLITCDLIQLYRLKALCVLMLEAIQGLRNAVGVGVGVSTFPEKSVTKVYSSMLLALRGGGWGSNFLEKALRKI